MTDSATTSRMEEYYSCSFLSTNTKTHWMLSRSEITDQYACCPAEKITVEGTERKNCACVIIKACFCIRLYGPGVQVRIIESDEVSQTISAPVIERTWLLLDVTTTSDIKCVPN